MTRINVLSLFGGIECGRVAMDRLGWEVGNYYSSEIDEYAKKITSARWPDIIHVGSVTDLFYKESTGGLYHGQGGSEFVGKIDILIGGSPCQDLSIAKAWGKGLEGEKSGLFYEYVRILQETKPEYFLLENVASMRKADRDEITRIIGVEPIMINSALVSAQNRKRLYWTNIPGVKQPEDREIYLKDILEDIPTDDERWKPIDEKFLTEEFYKKIEWRLWQICEDKSYAILSTFYKENVKSLVQRKKKWLYIAWIYQKPRWKNSWGITYDGDKAPTITGSFEDNSKLLAVHDYIYLWRKLTPIECERLQTLPDNYTEGVSNSRRYKAIGNGWTVDVIKHILSFAKF